MTNDTDPFTAKAAHEWRLLQARHMLLAYREAVGHSPSAVELEAWVSAGKYEKPSTNELHEFRMALGELRAFRDKYRGLPELDDLIEVIDATLMD